MFNTQALAATPDDRRRTIRELAMFFGLAYAITWGLGAAIIFARPQLEALVGPLGQINHHWLYYLAVCAPTISAIACSLMFGGLGGLKALALRFVRPVKPLWVLTAILFWPAALTVYALAADALGHGGGIDLHALAVGAPVMALTTWALVIDPGGLGEETGWRGYAMPRLMTLTRPAWAAMGLGLVWSLWHLPAFFVSGLAQSQFALGWFIVGGMALSVVMAWLFVHGNGNPLIAGVIPHLMWNLPFDAHVFRSDPLRQEVPAVVALAVLLVVLLGPGLDGWRRIHSAARAAPDPA
jgi:membrane protease YdiL (CAAX protease family)